MRRLIAFWLASLIIVAGLTSSLMFAQFGPYRTPEELAKAPVLSGSDIGFRVEGTNRTGEPLGRLMIRVRGEWVEARFMPDLRAVE